MRVTLTDEERAVVEATLRFANLSRIRSTKQVQEIFRRVPLAGQPFRVLPETEWRAFLGDQRELRGWLAEIAERGEAARATVGARVAERLGTIETRITYVAEAVRYAFALSGVQAAYSYGAALILDGRRGLTGRLGRCGWCERFWLELEGKPRRHCNEEHRRAWDQKMAAERMRRWRARRGRSAREGTDKG